MDKFHEDLLLKLKVVKLVNTINRDTLAHIRESLQIAQKNGIEELTLEIASDGGDIPSAHKIFDVISNSPIRITGLVKPVAFSSAAIILQACHVRKIIRTGTILFHDARHGSYYFKNFMQGLKKTRQDETFIKRLIARRSKLTYRSFDQLNRYDFVLNAEQALAFGFVDEILQPPPKQAVIQPGQKSETLELFNESEFFTNLRIYDEFRIKGNPPIELILIPKGISDNCLLYLYELLLHYPGHVTVTAVRGILELMPLILLAGDKRQAYFNCDFLLQEPYMFLEMTTIYNALKPPVQKLLGQRLKSVNQFVKSEFLRRSNLSAKEYRHLTNSKFTFAADDAIKYGICQKIIIPDHLKKK
jgi:ATP-dependent protease ClpP protease subunit